LPEPGRLRHRRQRQRSWPDLLPVAHDVLSDLENCEGRDARGEPGKAHERDSDDKRIDRTDRGGDHERAGIPNCVIPDDGEDLRQDASFGVRRHRQLPGRVRADDEEADLTERDHA
jgi:hypothetical protein